MTKTCKRWLGAALTLALANMTACSSDDDVDEDRAANDEFFNNAGAIASPMAGNSGVNGESGTGLAPGNCAEGSVRASRVRPRVVLVLDGSCSMSTPYPANGAPSSTMCTDAPSTRWSELRNALMAPNTGVVTRLSSLIEFGMVVYGTQPRCPLTANPIQPALDNAGAIGAALGQRPPGNFTPTGAALEYVYENLIEPYRPDSNQGPQIVLLATDGEPNSCNNATTNYDPSVNAVRDSRGIGVTTYVVSLADSQGEFRSHLQELATLGAGPGARLYEPTNPAELAADLELLIGGAVTCDITLNGRVEPTEACEGTVTLNGQALGCDDPNGWTLIDPRHIRLQGSACEALKNDANASFSADFACSSFSPD